MYVVALGQGSGHGMCSSWLEDHLIKLLHLGGAVLGSERPLAVRDHFCVGQLCMLSSRSDQPAPAGLRVDGGWPKIIGPSIRICSWMFLDRCE